ncbi:MAG: CPBP family intramembrane metalloprotease [Bacilli bacterium]|nr:CPBP family intramembrane metalloprotease [Bacilli bacterium]
MKERIINLIKLLSILFIFFNIGYIISFIFLKLGFNLEDFSSTGAAYADALISIILFLLILSLYYKSFKNDYTEFKINLNKNIKKCFILFGVLLLVKLGASVITSILAEILKVDFAQSDNQNLLEGLIKVVPIMMIISSVIIAPVIEEGIFRLGFRKVIKNPTIYVLISGLIFGVMHVFPTEHSLVLAILQSVIYVSLGVALACIYLKEKNIYFVIIPHALNNLLGIVAALIFL